MDSTYLATILSPLRFRFASSALRSSVKVQKSATKRLAIPSLTPAKVSQDRKSLIFTLVSSIHHNHGRRSQNDKPVTEHDIPSWMKIRESDPANVTPSSAAIQKHQALPDDTSLRKSPSTMIKCIQETAASFLPHVERSNSIKEFAAKAHQDSSNQKEQPLQGGPRCLNETYSKRIETTILRIDYVEILVDFLVSLLDLEKWHLVIGELWFCAKPSGDVKFTEENLTGIGGDDSGVYHIHSSDPHTETLWSMALTMAIEIKIPTLCGPGPPSTLACPCEGRIDNRDNNKSILKITGAICEIGTTEVALRDTNLFTKHLEGNIRLFVQKVESRSKGKKLPPAGHWT
ncbi:uncharacterized protein CLUP02_01391 [Colletotrichum lupini]|uniref:Uncharacterized protein n=1 Tax=Colletotrichum lupini TaxID=145971 RepID=A0A9Q8W947_9PEZI|nr:uncharacterized protein CLUP02_01391 [Colletotrichum lupini]UQC74739.1 hypothetical protein CLUP02_01391 [Colletotrichum lupini]